MPDERQYGRHQTPPQASERSTREIRTLALGALLIGGLGVAAGVAIPARPPSPPGQSAKATAAPAKPEVLAVPTANDEFINPTTSSSTTTTTIKPAKAPRSNIGIPAVWLEKLPKLPQLCQLFPDKCSQQNINPAGWLTYVNDLNQAVQVTPDDYRNLVINTHYENTYTADPNYAKRITPEALVVHWTVENFHNNPQNAAVYFRSHNERVEFYINQTGDVYQLFDSDSRYPAHARGANTSTQGVEIEAPNLLGYTPQEIKSIVLLAVDFDRRNHLPISVSTIVGHYAIDLLYDNPTYNNDSGSFSTSAKVDKIDPPQEMMDIIDQKAITLDSQLGT